MKMKRKKKKWIGKNVSFASTLSLRQISWTHVFVSIFLLLICAAIRPFSIEKRTNFLLPSPSASCSTDIFFLYHFFPSIPVTVFQQWVRIPINSKIITRTRLRTIPWRPLLFHWYLDRINTDIRCIHSTRYRCNGEYLLRSWPKGLAVYVVNSIIERIRYCHDKATGFPWEILYHRSS